MEDVAAVRVATDARATASAPAGAPGALDTSSSPPVRTGRPTCRPACGRDGASTWSPRTTTATPASSGPGGVLVVGASASGVQIADELTRAGREVTLAVGRHTRMPAALPGPGHLLVAGEHRAAGPDHRRDRRPGGGARARPSLQLVGRNDPERAAEDLDLGRLQDRGVRLVGRLDAVEAARPGSATTSPPQSATRTPRLHRLLDRLDRYVERVGLGGQVWDGRGPDPSWSDPRARGSTCARRASTPSWSPPATARTTRGCGCRSPSPTGPSASTAASPPAAGRRTSSASGSSTGATPATSTGPGTTPRRSCDHLLAAGGSSTDGVASARSTGAGGMSPLRRRRRGRPGRRRLHRPAAGTCRPPVALVDRGRHGSDTVSTHALMRAGVLQLSRWGVLDGRRRRRHAADPAHGLPLPGRRGRRRLDPARAGR